MCSVIKGEVIEGKKLGRKLGFPTANIELEVTDSTPNGIYAVEVELDGIEYFGVANIGIRPTIKDSDVKLLEVYIFDLSKDIYGKELRVKLSVWLREERKFEDIDELQRQIAEDVESAKKYFKL